MTEIIARAGNITAKIKPHRPSWSDARSNYMGEEISSPDFYPMISDELALAASKFPDDWANTCATRMSYALNRSGMRLPKAYSAGGTVVGRDGFNYWIRVRGLKKYLNDRFKGGDIDHKLKPIQELTQESMDTRSRDAYENIITKIQGKTGIVVFDVTGWRDASGHFTLWDGKDLVYVGPGDHNNPRSIEYYFWFYRPSASGNPKQTVRVLFWELK